MQALRRVISFLGPYRHWAILAPLAMAVEVAMDLMQPRLVQQIVDQGIIHHDMAVVVHSGAWMIGLAVIGMVGGAGCTMLSVLAAQGMGADLRSTVFRKVQALSFGNLDRLDTGALITRLTNDISQVQDTVMMALRIMVRAPLMLLGSLAMGFVTSPRLSLLFLFLIPTILAVLAWTIRRTFPLFSEVQRRLDTVNTVLQENLAGVRVVKAFGRSVFEMERFGTANDRLMDQNTLALRISAVTMPAVMLTMNAGIVGVLWLGGVLVIRHGLQIGQIIAFINYLMQTLMSLMMVSMLVLRVSRANASAQRIEEVLVAKPDVPAPSAVSTGFEPRGRVAFEDVSFRYNSDDSDPVLRHVSFTAEPGQTVALLGATGAGKSSLVNLIPRFYDVTEGRVMIDGVDVRQMDEASLGRAVGIALQESILFTGTMRDNIRYGRPDADDEQVISAARMARADEFIQQLPDGYDTMIGQRGVNLSGGQKQRVAIARALLARPAILILDDSTSAVDVETEAAIQDAMARERAGRTCFVVAQRITTVRGADKILVLDDGQIVAEGRHDELMDSSTVYREICMSQIGDGEADSLGD